MRPRALAALLLLLPAESTGAGEITLQLQSTAELGNGSLRVALKVTNAGNDTAFALRPRVALGEREVLGGSHASLVPGGSFDVALTLAAPVLGPGRWPFRVAVDYADGNSHPFQSLQAGLLVVGQPAPFALALQDIEATPLQDRGSLKLALRNEGPSDVRARVSLLVPADLEPPPRSATPALAPRERRELALPLGVRTALVGSRYAIYVLVEYDEAGAHQALLAEAVVEVRARRARLAPLLVAAALALLLSWAALLQRRRGITAASPP
jgi:hypothetical protein